MRISGAVSLVHCERLREAKRHDAGNCMSPWPVTKVLYRSSRSSLGKCDRKSPKKSIGRVEQLWKLRFLTVLLHGPTESC